MPVAVAVTDTWVPMSKGTDVLVQAGSKSVLENGRDRGIWEEKWMRDNAGKGLQERLAMGTLSLMPTLAVLDSYQRQPIDEQIERHQQILAIVLCSCCFLSSRASCFTPSCQHNVARAVSLQWDHFLYPATPFQAHLKYLPVPQYHLSFLSAELQHDGDNLT